MARTTPWTPEQEDALVKLREMGAIRNERKCGCFDILVEEYPDDPHYKGLVKLIPCDTCREALIAWKPDLFGIRE